MKYCQLAIFSEHEIEIEIQPKVTLDFARRSIVTQVRSLSKYYEIPEYLMHLALVTDYMEKLNSYELMMYVTLFLAQITVVPELYILDD
jgi:predicted component of type VI protein secretion system